MRRRWAPDPAGRHRKHFFELSFGRLRRLATDEEEPSSLFFPEAPTGIRQDPPWPTRVA